MQNKALGLEATREQVLLKKAEGIYADGRGQKEQFLRGFRPQPIANTVQTVGFYTLLAPGTENKQYHLLPYILIPPFCPLPSAFPG
jgi:hypothetical protein